MVFDLGRKDDAERLEQLFANTPDIRCFDTLATQLRGLIETRHPDRTLDDDQLGRLANEHRRGVPLVYYGSWIYFPWVRRLLHMLPEAEFCELRTSRNRNKLTLAEQQRLAKIRIGIVGLSVGQTTAVTLALEGVGGHLRLADFDHLELSNLNRLRAGVADLGLNKAVLTARQIYEIDPYAQLELFVDGVDDSNLDAFLDGGDKLDLVFDECDDLAMKIRVRERARQLRIPVLMETSDRGLIDVERFDLEGNRPLLHGLIGGLDADDLRGLSNYEKVPTVMKMIGAESMSRRLAGSLVDVETTVKTWPQLASAVALGGAVNTDVARRIALGEFTGSGRYYVDLEQLVCDGVDGRPPQAPSYDVEAIEEAKQAPSVPSVTPADKVSDTLVRDLVRYATLAPSGGNCQPWRFEFSRGVLRVFHDVDRSRSFLDYRHTASYLAIGAAVENLSLAAQRMGLEATVSVFPTPADLRLVCTVRFQASSSPDPANLALAEQIPRRVTNRRLSPRVPLGPDDGQALVETAKLAGARLQLVTDEDALDEAGDILARGDRLRLLHEQMHREMMAEIRWNARDTARTRDGLDIATLELTPTDLAGMRLISGWRVMDLVGRLGAGRGLEKPSRKSVAAASAVGLLSFEGTQAASYFAGGRALQRVWLRATQCGLAFQPMTALVYVMARLERGGGEGLSVEEQTAFGRFAERLGALFEITPNQATLMLFRLAHAPEVTARSLRRHVADVLTIAR